jgi:hypothetical protein
MVHNPKRKRPARSQARVPPKGGRSLPGSLATPSPRESLRELDWSAARRYVELLDERHRLLRVGDLDLDLGQLVMRRFDCDCRKCMSSRGQTILADRSCCARYRIELTRADRVHLGAIVPRVRRRLPEGHRLRDPGELPFELDSDYRATLIEDERGLCPFVLHERGRSVCAIHRTCEEEGLDVWTYKPLSCSLWPIATIEYQASAERRVLVTAYGLETHGLFADDEEGADVCVCLRDQDAAYPPVFEAQSPILARVYGASVVRKLRAAARALTKGRATTAPRPRPGG